LVASLPNKSHSVTIAVGEDILLRALYMGRLRPSREPMATREFKRETRAVIHIRPLNAVSRCGGKGVGGGHVGNAW
jgi:hypothetical protein